MQSLLTDPPAAPLYVKLTIVSITSGDVKGLGDRACYWALMHSIGLCGIVHCMHLPKHMFTSGLSNVTIVSLVTLYNTEQLSALNLVYLADYVYSLVLPFGARLDTTSLKTQLLFLVVGLLTIKSLILL